MTHREELEHLIAVTHRHGIELGHKVEEYLAKKLSLEKLNRLRREELQSLKAKPRYFTMYDSIDAAQIPSHANAVAGYVGGKWPSYAAIRARFPHARHLSIAITDREHADCLDVESGDATPAQAPGWVMTEKMAGNHKPVLYASLNVWPEIDHQLALHAIPLAHVRRWVAHYTGIPYIPFGFDACQYDSKETPNIDVSLCFQDFLP